jgi:hypothetical protein
MFQTNQGPSFPAHQFIFGGTSALSASDDSKAVFAPENVYFGIAGCTAGRGTVVPLSLPPGVESKNYVTYPYFEHKTMPDLFSSKVTWKYYAPDAPGFLLIWLAPNAIQFDRARRHMHGHRVEEHCGP